MEGEGEQAIVLTELSDEEIQTLEQSDESKDIESLSPTSPTTFMDSVGKLYQMGEVSFPSMKNVKPWGEFFSDFGEVPMNPVDLYKRSITNVQHFMPNYMILLAILTLYGILVTPTLLLFSLMAIGYTVYRRSWAPETAPKTFDMFGHKWEFGDKEKINGVWAACITLSVVTGSILVLIPTTICGFLGVSAHMIAHKPKEEELFSEVNQEE